MRVMSRRDSPTLLSRFLALSAGAAIHRQEAADSEVLLEQAGFQARAADSPLSASRIS